MTKFIIQPHGRLQKWIAHEKGCFRNEGLDYEFVRGPSSDTTKKVKFRRRGDRFDVGRFQVLQDCWWK